MQCSFPSVALYKAETSDWCEQFCVNRKMVDHVKQIHDAENGYCKDHGYTHYDHTEDTDSIIFGHVDLYKKGALRSSGSPAFIFFPRLDRGSPIGRSAVPSVTQKDCQAFKLAQDFTNSSVIWDQASSSCRFWCAASQSLACLTSPDGFLAVLQTSGLGSERSVCNTSMKPSDDKPLLVTVTCPEWRMVVDMHGQQRMGAMTVEVVMYKDSVVDAVRKAVGPPQIETVVV